LKQSAEEGVARLAAVAAVLDDLEDDEQYPSGSSAGTVP
jgi:hypothetical protein